MPDRARPFPDPRWTAPQSRLWEAHAPRLPNPGGASALLERWFDAAGPPPGETAFLHLMYLAGTSEALFLALLRHPGQLPMISRQANAPQGLGHEGMDEALARHLLSRRWPTPASAFSAFRAVQTARILLQDVLGILSFESITRELSCLADVLVRRSLALTYQPLRESLGMPLVATSEGRPASCKMAVFALGKLGGMELNYASDVDLVVFYENEGTTDLGRHNGAFFNAWTQAAVGLLTAPTPDGPCLRVDQNLRPRGRDGELTLSMEAALAYYREWADLWERQAWIKARTCAGDEELGARFLRQMDPVVYQPYSWAGIARQVRRAREKTVLHLGESGTADLKEGPGGIRDAEFAVQALQLAHGPAGRWVREPNTLLALSKLAQKDVLSTARQSALARHYTLLRRAEHWAQVQDMRQAHRMPKEERDWTALARYLRLAGAEEARRSVEEARAGLRNLFYQVLGEMEGRDAEQDLAASMLTPEGMLEVLKGGRFQDPQRALPLLAGIYTALAPHLNEPQRKENLLRIHFSLRREFKGARDPYQGLAALYRLVQALAGEPGALGDLLDRPRLPRLLFRLAVQSEPLTEALMRMPALVRLLSYEAMRGVETHLAAVPSAGEGPDALRRWQKEAMILAEGREVVFGETAAWSQAIHSELADRVCAAVFEGACQAVEGREGLEPGLLGRSLGLLALGRHGLAEMHPRSDLDLVVVKAGAWVLGSDPERSARAEAGVLREMAGALAAVTRHGSLYEADFRLRPYGASGLPVQSLDTLREYFSGPARLWERLSYLKGRPVAGNEALGWQALDLVWDLVLSRGAPDDELGDLMDLRGRLEAASPGFEGALKFRPGGLLHLDVLGSVLLARARLRPGPGGSEGLLRRLEEAGILGAEDRRCLSRARSFMDGFLHRSRLHVSRSPKPAWPEGLLDVLDGLWSPRPSGAVSDLPPGTLVRLWEECRADVARLWAQLTRAPLPR